MSEFEIPITTASFSQDYSSCSSNDSDHPEKRRRIYLKSDKPSKQTQHHHSHRTRSTTKNISSMTTTLSPNTFTTTNKPHFTNKQHQIHNKSSLNKKNIILQYSIDPYEYSDEELIELSLEIFQYYQLPKQYSFTINNLKNFLQLVKNLYQSNNNFHNFKHAWGVMHMSFQLLIHGVDKCLTSFDIFAVLVAAICHDAGHPGNNNAFEFAIQSEVSQKYSKPNENCVLERYHFGLTKDLLISKKEDVDNADDDDHHHLLDGLNEEEQEKFLDQINFIILGTDMAKHGALVEEAKQLVKKAQALLFVTTSECDNGSSESKKIMPCDSGSTSSSGKSDIQLTPKGKRKHSFLNMESPTAINSPVLSEVTGIEQLFATDEARLALTRILVHTADIGAQTQENSIAFKWVSRCYNEFQTQANKEKELGIITTPFLHELTDDKKIFASQYSFINDIVEPIWKAFTELFPDLQFAKEQLISNKTSYQKYF